MNFDEPGNYHLISEYAENNHILYWNIRKNRPDILKDQTALNDYSENCLYENSYPNTGYIKGLNFEIKYKAM